MRALHPSLKRRANWHELLRFSIVGASGYVVNLLVFTFTTQTIDLDYRVAAVIAFCIAVANNFALNRHWTFKAHDGHAGFQAARFLIVSLLALGANLLVLELLIAEVGLGEITAQAIAVIVATPFNFLGNKLWSFKI